MSFTTKNFDLNLNGFLCELPDPIIAINQTGIILHCNKATFKFFGYEDDELTGKNVSVLMPESEAKDHDRHLNRYVTTGDKHIIGIGRKVTARAKDGRFLPVHLTISEQKTANGFCFIGLLRDLSEVDTANKKLEATLYAAPSIIMFIDPEMKIQFVNHGPEDRTVADLLGKPVVSFLDEANKKILEDAFKQAMNTRTCVQFLNRYVTQQGKEQLYEGFLNPVHSNASFDGAVLVANNVTDRYTQQKRIESLLSQKETLLKEVFHRVKNNFQVMDSLLALHQDSETSDESRTTIEKVRNRIYALGSVHNLIYQDSLTERLDLAAYLESIASHLATATQVSNQLRISTPAPLQHPHVNPKQAVACGSVLNELVANSLKYAQPSQTPVSIFYGLTKNGDSIHFWYCDSGPYYSSADETGTHKPGLGTRIMKGFSETINGVQVKEPTTAWIASLDETSKSNLTTLPKYCIHLKFKELPMKHFLVVEDEPIVREHIANELKKISPDCEVHAFKSVEDLEAGLPALKKVDLALFDINLGTPRTGIDAAKIVRMKYATRLIFLTSYSDEDTLSKIASVDPDAFITKPFAPTQFHATIKTVMTRKSVNPETLISGDMLSLEETFRNLSDKIVEIEKLDKKGDSALAVTRFREAEKLFFQLKENQTQEIFTLLLNSTWISSLKLQKIVEPTLKEAAQKYTDIVLLAIAQMKAMAKKKLQ